MNLLNKAIVAVSVLMMHTLPTMAAPVNLVNNGDFELGNVNFGSDYDYSPSSNSAEAQYTIRTNPFPWNGSFVSVGDHTSGTGNMFVGNGDSTPESIVWQSLPISVLPSTTYFFEAWAMNVCCTSAYPGSISPAVLEFTVVGSTIESLGVISTSQSQAGNWQSLGTSWNSGANTSVTLQIIDQNTSIEGNDFAIDDIKFGAVSPVPEPSSILLMLSGLALVVGGTRRGRRISAIA